MFAFRQGGSQPSDEAKGNSISKHANPLTYPKSGKPFSQSLFQNPSSEYRGCPLWSWNTKLVKDQMLRQIDNFQAMGLGGFYMHVRVGLDTEYMGEEFMNIVQACVEYAESKGMMACLYDDDRWPSGVAGGKVIEKFPEHKGKHLLFTPSRYGTVPLGGDRSPASARASRSENGTLLAKYDIELDENGCLKSVRMLDEDEPGENVWYAYEETNPSSPWFNDHTYVDTLSKEAIGRFIAITHEVYKAKIGSKFGTTVPSIFTDEPQFATLTQLSNPRAREDIFIPWTSDIQKSFKKDYSTNLLPHLPEVVWDLPNGKSSLARYQFHDHVCERFVSAFMDQIAAWCKKNGLILNGHMMEEPTLQSQSCAVGEVMRCYRNMDMPGIDLLVDGIEYNTAKQCSSVARQRGVRGAMSEIYGVSHWYFTFEGHKGCGDWQAALGITFRVHHLTWVSMAGEGKRDYPASIGYQSPWYKEYGHVENHFARVGVAMTRGHALTHVAVIHPIESYWVVFGPNGRGDEMQLRDRAFGDLTDWLIHASIDFDFISESILPSQVGKIGKELHVGACKYKVVIVPNLRTIRSSTLKVLREFAKAGGQVIIAGSAPDLVDAVIPKHSPTIDPCTCLFWSKNTILSALENYREVKITNENGSLTERLLHQLRHDANGGSPERFLFICNEDRNNPVNTVISMKGHWNPIMMDTLTGAYRLLPAKWSKGWTTIHWRFEGCASLLVRFTAHNRKLLQRRLYPKKVIARTPGTIDLKTVKLSEPNAFLLDYAEYRIDRNNWSAPTQILRIDNEIRSELRVPLKGEAWKQPWAVKDSERKPLAGLQLRYVFESTFDIREPLMLAMEDPDQCNIRINGLKVPNNGGPISGKGWWVDECIKTVALPYGCIKKGNNVLSIDRPFGILTNLESIYILGNFGVELNGHEKIMKPFNLQDVTWGDITKQGLPFYVGNISYDCTITIPKTPQLSPTKPPQAPLIPTLSAPSSNPKRKHNITLSVPQFSSPVLTVTNTNSLRPQGHIAFQPRTLILKNLDPPPFPTPIEEPNSSHDITITAFGNRYNAFGHLHLPRGRTNICGPGMFRTGGDWWTDEYAVMEMGVLEGPGLWVDLIEEVASSMGSGEGEKEGDEWVIVDG